MAPINKHAECQIKSRRIHMTMPAFLYRFNPDALPVTTTSTSATAPAICSCSFNRAHAQVTEQRTQTDFAQVLHELVAVHFPHAEKIRVVLDNLNTYTPAALYVAFPPAEARRILSKLEFHYPPKHASWLNMVEIELSVLVHQCLKRRIPDMDTLVREVAAWQAHRNATGHWQFDVAQARTKLSHLYPQLPS